MLITKEKTKAPPLYMPKPKTCQDKKHKRDRTDMPSSGVMVRVKFRRSAGSGKLVIIVEGRSSSVKSYDQREV